MGDVSIRKDTGTTKSYQPAQECRWQFHEVAPSPSPWPTVLIIRQSHQILTCQLRQEQNNALVSNKTCLLLQKFYVADSKFNTPSSCHCASFFTAISEQLLSGFSFLPTSLLNVTLCTPLNLSSCWFQTLELKMLLNSDSRHRGAFPNLQICIFTLYSVIQIISETVGTELTLKMTWLKMLFQHDSKPLTATFGEGCLQVITHPLNEKSYHIFMRTLHLLLITVMAGETEQWNTNTYRELASHESARTHLVD